MPVVDKDRIEKLYYTIGEVADMLDVNLSLIRFWEKEFDVFNLKKNKKGNRLFTAKDIDLLRKIHHLVKVKGFTLEGARKALKEGRAEAKKETVAAPKGNAEAIEKLRSIRAELVSIIAQF